MEIKQAVILTGGQGKRLRPFTLTNNKCMYPINGKPFLWHLIKLLKKNGIKRVLVLTGWKAEKVKVEYPGVEISYHYTPFKSWFREIKSTIRIKNAFHLLDDYFLLMYCDNWWNLKLKELIKNVLPEHVLGVNYLGKDLGFFLVPKEIIKNFPKVNKPIERLLEKEIVVHYPARKYYSISDPIRAEKTERYLKHVM